MLLDVIEEHLDEVSSLYVRWKAAPDSPPAPPTRLRAHLDALLHDTESAWNLCQELLEEGTAGGAFAAGWVAIHSGRAEALNAFAERGSEEVAAALRDARALKAP